MIEDNKECEKERGGKEREKVQTHENGQVNEIEK